MLAKSDILTIFNLANVILSAREGSHTLCMASTRHLYRVRFLVALLLGMTKIHNMPIIQPTLPDCHYFFILGQGAIGHRIKYFGAGWKMTFFLVYFHLFKMHRVQSNRCPDAFFMFCGHFNRPAASINL